MRIKKAILEMMKGNHIALSRGQTQYKLMGDHYRVYYRVYYYPGSPWPWRYFGTLGYFDHCEGGQEFRLLRKGVTSKVC